MIGKIFNKNSGSFKGRIRYIFGCSKHDHEISRIITIDSNCLTPDPLPGVQAGDDGVLSEMVSEFDEVEIFRKLSIDSTKQIKPVFHAMLSLRPGESLTPEQWQTAVRDYLRDLGFTETCKYVAIMHQDTDHQHVHIVANRIQLEEGFRLVSDSNERSISIDSVSRIEDKFGLEKAPKPHETWGTDISREELEASVKDNDIPFKHKMIAKVAASIERTRAMDGDMTDFVRLLRKQKIYIHFTLDDQGQPKGIAYEYQGKVISGRQLKRSRLTWQKLTRQEGINYDPETISSLQAEIAIRDKEGRVTSRRIQGRWWYYRFDGTDGSRKYYRFKSREQELEEMIELILMLLLLLFGISYAPRATREKYKCLPWQRGEPLPDDPEPHPAP